ncbi:MAG: hypothetical protein QOG23_2665 [Blastocatellia bacterium]|jgi:hypothetical protein|nr:hypothetical protein [Blastocatellia bacterium]
MQIKGARPWAIAIVLGVLGTIQYHRAQFTSRFDTFFGDRGDVRGVVYFCEHWYQWLLGNTQLMSPGIFYPTKGTLAYSDFLVGYAVPYAVVRALGFGMFSSMEIVVILLTFFNYFACFFLLKHVLRFSLLPSIAAAMFFAFNSPKFFQTGHLQLQYVVFLPLIFACVISFARKSEKLNQRNAGLLLGGAGILWLLQAVTAFYYAWFLIFWGFLFLLMSLIFNSSRLFLLTLIKNYWRAVSVSSALFLLGFGLFLLSYLPGIRAGSWYPYEYVTQMIPPRWSLLSMGDGNYLWGWLSAAVMPDPWPPTWGELKIGIGLVPSLAWILITVLFVWRLRKSPNEIAVTNRSLNAYTAAPAFLMALVFATTLFYLIGFNYWHDHSPWFFVYKYFPGAKAIRAVSRYVIFLSLPMAIAFAYVIERGLQWAATRKTRAKRRVLSVIILVIASFGIFEQFGVFKVGGTGFSKKTEEAYLKAMANKLSNDCAAFYITPGPNGKHNAFEYQYDAMLISSMTAIPTLNASSSQFPHDWLLYPVSDPEYENNVKRWIALNHLNGKVCRLEVGPQVEAFDARAPSPLDDASFFVRQQYSDLAGREPTVTELQPSVDRVQKCKVANSCDRAEIALEIFRSTGFSDEGSFLYRLYQVAFARAPRYEEFAADLAAFRERGKNQLKFVDSFVSRDEFVNCYSAMSTADYMNKLADNSGASKEDRQALISSQKGRTQVLLELSGDSDASRIFSNRAFVTLLYFGYLRRDPDPKGFEDWLRFLERTGDFARITSGFVNSIEYRQRFFS